MNSKLYDRNNKTKYLPNGCCKVSLYECAGLGDRYGVVGEPKLPSALFSDNGLGLNDNGDNGGNAELHLDDDKLVETAGCLGAVVSL